MGKKAGFSLLELVVVIIILSVFATLAIRHYAAARENALDKEAISNLKLLNAAQKSYFLDIGTYFPSAGSTSNIGAINSAFKLLIPASANRYWNYQVWSTGCCQATRNGADNRSWHMSINDADGIPDAGAGC